MSLEGLLKTVLEKLASPADIATILVVAPAAYVADASPLDPMPFLGPDVTSIMATALALGLGHATVSIYRRFRPSGASIRIAKSLAAEFRRKGDRDAANNVLELARLLRSGLITEHEFNRELNLYQNRILRDLRRRLDD